MGSACKSFQLQLSAYADGELAVKERAPVELHLAGCGDCRARVEDLKAMSSLLSERLMAHAEAADFSRFSDQVMARVTPYRAPLLERIRIGWGEIVEYHRTAVISSFATAAMTLLIGVPVAVKLVGTSAVDPVVVASASSEIVLRELNIDNPDIQPVVMKTADGHTLIMLVNHREEAAAEGAPALDVKPPTGGDL